jgi:hypothetical protein
MTSPDAIAGVIYSGFMTKKTACAAIKAARRANVEWLEILFHPGRAAPEEAHRWAHKPSIGKFYLDARRDVERDALIDFGGHRRLCHIDSHVNT